MSLIEELNRQRQAVAEFRGAIAAIAAKDTPTGFMPIKTEPLAILQDLMASSADEAERAARLAQAQAALAQAEAALEKLEDRYKVSSAKAEAAAEKLRSLAADFNDDIAQFQSAIAEKLATMQSVAAEAHQSFSDVGWEVGFKKTQFFEAKWADTLPVAMVSDGRQILLSRLEIERRNLWREI